MRQLNSGDTMAQDFMVHWISGHLSKQEAAKVQAALQRMGLRNDPNEWNPLRWELLNWFVVFSQRKDIPALTEAECSLLDEEIQTIQLLGSFTYAPWVPNREEMKALADEIHKILSDLTERGVARIGPLPIEFVVWRGTEKQDEIPEAQRARGVVKYEGWGPALIGHPPAEGIAFQVPPAGKDALIHCLAQLLSRYPGAVRRCPHGDEDCRKLFAQFRSSAIHCSRQCQTRAYAKEQWKKNVLKATEKKAADEKKAKLSMATKQKRKKEIHHGKKK